MIINQFHGIALHSVELPTIVPEDSWSFLGKMQSSMEFNGIQWDFGAWKGYM